MTNERDTDERDLTAAHLKALSNVTSLISYCETTLPNGIVYILHLQILADEINEELKNKSES